MTARLEREDLTVLAHRFEGDRFCQVERFAAYDQQLYKPTSEAVTKIRR